MAAGYAMVLAAMAQSAASARSAADQIGGVDLAGTLDGLDQALPGSRSAGKLTQVRQAWQGRTQSLAQQVRSHAQAIESAREGYTHNEGAAKRDLHAVNPGASQGGC